MSVSVEREQSYSADTIHHILRNKRRRAVLFYLIYNDDEATVRELSNEIAAWELGKSVEKLSAAERERVYISLHQTHLKTLDSEGIVEYNEDRKIVHKDSGLEFFRPYVDPKEASNNIEQLMSEDHKTVYAGLKQDQIERTLGARVLEVLTPTLDPTDQWSTYYLGLALLGGIFILIASPLTPLEIPMIVPAVLQTIVLAAIGFIHAFAEAERREIATAEEMFLGSLRPSWADDEN